MRRFSGFTIHIDNTFAYHTRIHWPDNGSRETSDNQTTNQSVNNNNKKQTDWWVYIPCIFRYQQHLFNWNRLDTALIPFEAYAYNACVTTSMCRNYILYAPNNSRSIQPLLCYFLAFILFRIVDPIELASFNLRRCICNIQQWYWYFAYTLTNGKYPVKCFETKTTTTTILFHSNCGLGLVGILRRKCWSTLFYELLIWVLCLSLFFFCGRTCLYFKTRFDFILCFFFSNICKWFQRMKCL